MSEDLDWDKAKKRLDTLHKRYNELPASSSWFALSVLEKLRERFVDGERSEELYNEIMNFKL